MLHPRKFLTCTVLVNQNNNESLAGSDKKIKQGLELEYTFDTTTKEQQLTKILIVGFANKTSITSSQITGAGCRFIEEGKATILTKTGVKILLSRATESDLISLVNDLKISNPSIVVTPQATPDKKTILTYREKRKPDEKYEGNKKRRAFNITRSNEDNRQTENEEIKKPLRRIDEILNDDVLQIILTEYGKEPGISRVCRNFHRLIHESRRLLSIRQPSQHERAVNDLSIEQITRWVTSSPQLRSLNLSYYSSITPRDLERLLSHSKFPRSLVGFSLRNATNLNDSSIRNLLLRLRTHQLRRLDLTNIPTVSLNSLTPLRPGGLLSRRLECLWLGQKNNKINKNINNKLLEFLINENQNSVVFAQPASPPPLISFSLSGCPNLTDLPFISRIQSTLIELDLSSSGITDYAFSFAAASLSNLQFLNLSHTQIGNLSLSVLRRSCPNIEVIDLGDLTHPVLSSNFDNISNVWPNLKKLSIARQASFSNHHLLDLLIRSSSLQVLDISGCQNISLLFLDRNSHDDRKSVSPMLTLHIPSTALCPRTLCTALTQHKFYNISINDIHESRLFGLPNVPLYDPKYKL